MMQKSPRGRARSARRGLALLLVLAYAAASAAAEAQDAARASRPYAATREGGGPFLPAEQQQQRRRQSSRAHLSDDPAAAFLRLVEESATRSTQWFPAVGTSGGSGGRSSSGSGSEVTLLSPADGASTAAAALSWVEAAPAPAPLSPVVGGHAQQQQQQGAGGAALATTTATAGPSHAPLLPPRPSDFVVFLLAALTLFTAAGGGIGGGTLFVPLFSVIGGFAPTNAVALSNVTVFGGACANFLLNVRRPYARALRALPRNALSAVRRPPPLIDWTLILIMEPSTLVGALVGGYVHRLLPTWLLLTLLSALLIFLTWQLAHKAAATYAAETREQQRERAAEWANRAAGGSGGEGGGGVTAPLLGGKEEEEEDDDEEDGGSDDEDGKGRDDEEAARGQGNNKPRRSRRRPPPLIVVAAGLDSSTLALSDDVGGGDQDPSAAGSSSSSAAAAAAAAGGAAARTPAPRPPEDDPLERLLKIPARVPVLKLLAITALTAWMLGADVVKTRLPCGSALYTLASLSILPVALTLTLTQRAFVLMRAAAAAEAHEALDAARRQAHVSPRPPLSARGTLGPGAAAPTGRWSPEAVRAALASHVRWTRKNSVLYPLLSTLAGVCASMFGIGGGVVKGPLMLSLGVCPEVAAATSSTMILFTSAGASLFYFNAGFVQRDYAAALLVVAFVFTGLGQIASQRLVRILGRRSVIVMVMAAMMLAAAAVAVLQSAFATRAAVRAHDLWHWGSICSRGDD